MRKLLLCISAIAMVWSLAAQNRATMRVDVGNEQGEISRHIYGQFAEHLGAGIYGGIWVGKDSAIPNIDGYRTDVVEALKALHIPNLRWPGGCFADGYHWRDGIGAPEQRARIINTNWGGVVEDNSFGTHEFLNLCELLGTEPYICGNMGSGSVQEMADWVEYITFDGESPMADLRRANGRDKPWKVHFWGLGNESWGCGGNMSPEFYSDLYRRQATFLHDFGDNRLFKIAVGPSDGDYNWMKVCMQRIGSQMNAISLHHYTIPSGNWDRKGSATDYTTDEYLATLRSTLEMQELLDRHIAIMDEYDPQYKVSLAVDEWGIWADVEPGTNPGFLRQQNTLRDAIAAALNFNIFNAHCDRLVMANIAQMVNVLQSIILTDGDRMLLTPTYYAYDLYKNHMDATLVASHVDCPVLALGEPVEGKINETPVLSTTASVKNGQLTLSIVNIDPVNDCNVSCTISGKNYSSVSGKVLTAAHLQDHNTFDHPNSIAEKSFEGAKLSDNLLTATLPAKSIVTLVIGE